MTKFDFNDERFSIVDSHNQRVDLSPQEAIDLIEWLSDKKTMLLRLFHQDTEPLDSLQDTEPLGSQVEQIEIHLLPQHLVHLDKLQAAIPHLQEHIPATNIFTSPADSVTERAIELLKEFEIEYKIHPLLEDSNEFAQG